jgi:hypothetical protein
MGDACAVDQDVGAGELQNFLEYGSCACRLCEIAEVRGRDSARLIDSFRRLLCCLFVQVYDPNDSTMLCEAESDCLADAAGPAGYKRYFIFQTKSGHSVAPLCSTKKIKGLLQCFIGHELHVSTINIFVSLFETEFSNLNDRFYNTADQDLSQEEGRAAAGMVSFS